MISSSRADGLSSVVVVQRYGSCFVPRTASCAQRVFFGRATPRKNPTPSPSLRQTQRISSLNRAVPRRVPTMDRMRARIRGVPRLTM